MRFRLSSCSSINPFRKIILFLMLGVMSVGGWPALADLPAAPPGGPSSAFNPRLGTSHYQISWGPMTVAHAAVTLLREPEHYRVALESGLDGSIEELYRLQVTGEGKVSRDDFAPLESVYNWRKGSKERTTSVYYYGDGEIEAVEVEKKDGRNLKETVRNIQARGEVFDLFSAMVFARTFDWRVGLSKRFEVFTGKKTYEVTLTCISVEVYEEDGYKTKAWVLAPSVIDPAKAGEEPRHTSSRVYLSADDSRDILRIKTRTGIGKVEASLSRFEPALN